MPMRATLTTLSLVLGAALPLAAQQNGVTGVRNLGFGIVFPGIAKVISRTDAVNSGRFDLSGRKNGAVQLTFVLPVVMTGPLGATMPLVFGANDAGYSPTQSVGNETVTWDPRTPQTVTLPSTGRPRASVFLGGMVNPAVNQRAGSYTGTVILTAVFF
jgi:hypothetical protein